MEILMTVVGSWVAVSLPLGLVVGRWIRAGR